MAKGFKSILVLSDMHFPYAHPDIIPFLTAVKKKYLDPFKKDEKKVLSIGDEIDGQSFSFHPHDPDLQSPSDELALAIERMQPLYKLFPEVDIMESNHGSLIYRKAKVMGLPRFVFRNYRDVIQAPPDWHWHMDLTLNLCNGQKVYFTHGKTSAHGKLSQSMGMNTVQGHYHEKFEIIYWTNTLSNHWDARCGCLIDDASLAFNYNNCNLKRPIIGTLVIVNSQPVLVPLLMDKNKRWIGKL